jgi:hypothetical protein
VRSAVKREAVSGLASKTELCTNPAPERRDRLAAPSDTDRSGLGAPKRLSEHVRTGSFRARRHRHLLLGDRVAWPELAELQDEYASTTHELERREIAVRFERAVRSLRQRQPPVLSPGEELNLSKWAVSQLEVGEVLDELGIARPVWYSYAPLVLVELGDTADRRLIGRHLRADRARWLRRHQRGEAGVSARHDAI